MKYLELKDSGPLITNVEVMVKTLTKRLKAIKEIDDELYINALQSSALLCLADARGMSPYHNFSRQLNQLELDRLNKQLEPLGLTIFTENLLPFNVEPFETTVFAFINFDVLNKIPERYKFLDKFPYPALGIGSDDVLTCGTLEAQNYQLAKLMLDNKLPSEWLHDWFAPHNLRFGMELGYPGSAITALLWDEAAGKDDLMEILIDDKKEFDGTWVSFGVAPERKKARDVQKTVKLWTEIIQEARRLQPVDEILKQQKYEKATQAISI